MLRGNRISPIENGMTKCFGDNGTGPSLCGNNKGIHILSGTNVTVNNNVFEDVTYPIRVSATDMPGLHTITNNTASVVMNCAGPSCTPTNCARTQADSCCESFQFGGSGATSASTLSNNTLYRCKFGIEAQNGATVEAIGNTIKDSHVSAFTIRGSGKLKGASNRIKGAGWYNQSDCQRSGLAIRDGATTGTTKVDFGGGDCNAQPINVNGVATISSGGNLFCQKPSNSIDGDNHNDIRNANSGGCPAGSGCARAQSNCFDNGPDKIPDTLATGGSTTSCNCSF